MSGVPGLLAPPRVSVITAAYNAEAFIAATLASALGQRFRDFELIVLDDGSRDGTADVVRRIQTDDARVRLIVQENRGLAATRNRGVREARGELIAFLDHDDLWHPDKLACQVALLDAHAEAGVATCHSAVIGRDRACLGWRFGGDANGDVYREILEWDMVSGGSVALVRRAAFDAVGPFDETLPMRSDWDMWIRLARRFPFASVPRALVGYTRSEHSSSRSYDRMAEAGRRVLANVVRDDPAFRGRRYRFCAARDLFGIASVCTIDGELRLAWRFLLRSLALTPMPVLRSPRRCALVGMLLLRTALPAPAFRAALRRLAVVAFQLEPGRAFLDPQVLPGLRPVATQEPTAAVSADRAAAPLLSIVLVCASPAAIRKALRCYRAQGDSAQLELVVAAAPGAGVSAESLRGAGFPRVIVVPADTSDIAAAEGKAARATTSPLVVFAQAHAYPQPGFAAALLAAAQGGPWAAIGPAMINANPESAASRAAMWIGYGAWLEGQPAGVAASVPGHSSAYRREALLSLGDDLEASLNAGSALQAELAARGHSFYFDPAARVEIVNVSRWRWFAVDLFHQARLFAGRRRRGWSLRRRLSYAVAAPLIPFVRAVRIAKAIRRSGQGAAVWTTLPALALGLAASAAGECVGYLRGASRAQRSIETSMHRLRYVRAQDRRADADERRWPSAV